MTAPPPATQHKQPTPGCDPAPELPAEPAAGRCHRCCCIQCPRAAQHALALPAVLHYACPREAASTPGKGEHMRRGIYAERLRNLSLICRGFPEIIALPAGVSIATRLQRKSPAWCVMLVHLYHLIHSISSWQETCHSLRSVNFFLFFSLLQIKHNTLLPFRGTILLPEACKVQSWGESLTFHA